MNKNGTFQLDVYKLYAECSSLSEMVSGLTELLCTHFAPIRFSISINLNDKTVFNAGDSIEYTESYPMAENEFFTGVIRTTSPFPEEDLFTTVSSLISLKIKHDSEKFSQAAETTMRILSITFHDVRNTLGSISGIAQLMELDADGNEELLSSIHDVISIVKKFDEESTSTMKLFRNQPVIYKNDIFNLSDLCTKIMKRNGRVYQLSSINLVESVQDNIRCSGDESRVIDIFTELLVNAATALDVDGGTITVSVSQERDKAVISVTHDGPPIKNDIQEYIFIPFFTTKEKGRGLGLPRIARYLNDWGGSIRHESDEVHPVRFVVTLPITL